MVEVIDKTTLNIPPPEYRVYLNDLPTNDFNAVFKILPDFYKQLNMARCQKNESSVFIAGYPGTFYGRLFPDKCLHFIYSSYSLHWLSRIPPGLYDKDGRSINKGRFYISESSSLQVFKAYFDQFQEDFSLFLQSRSKELLPRGRMVLILLGRRDQSHVDRGNSFLWELLSRSFATLVSKGEVKQEKVDEYDSHFYAPSRNEIEGEVKKEGSFEIDRFEMFELEHYAGPYMILLFYEFKVMEALLFVGSKKASDLVKHITLKSLEETYISTTPESLGIADLGCSCGQNTLSTVREMVEVIDKTTLNIPPPEYRVYLNDLPTNDFNAVFKILPDFYKQLNMARCQKNESSVFIAGYPGTFYGRLFPDKCLHFIYSSYSLHWLSRIPPGLYDKDGRSINKGRFYISESSSLQVFKAYFDQFQEDFSLFLQSRSKELLPRGRMVLILLGRRDQSHVDRGNSFLWELLSRSFATLVSKGEVKQEKVDEYDSHFYAPSRNEIEDEVKKEGSFEIDRFEMFELEHYAGPYMSHGTAVAKSIRAIQESMISQHFGEEILDKLFEDYGSLIDEEMAIEDIKPINEYYIT
ncbi:hypothetical protein M8C21_014843, partial [Ambrosia artemisiifolia]